MGGRGAHNLVGIAAGANHVSQRFHSGTAIDIGDDVIIFIGVFFQELR